MYSNHSPFGSKASSSLARSLAGAYAKVGTETGVIGADAHRPTRVGDNYKIALGHLQAAGYTEVSFFLERQRQSVPIAAALASLR